MSIKILNIILLSCFYSAVQAQKLSVTPFIGVKFSKTKFLHDSRGEQTFYTNYQPYPIAGVEVSTRLKNEWKLLLKYRTMPIPVTYTGLLSEKPRGWYGPLFGGTSSSSGYPCWSLGVGVSKNFKNRRLLRHLIFNSDINVGFMAPLDSLGGSFASMQGLDGSLRNVKSTHYMTKPVFPYLSFGLQYQFTNRKHKEIISMGVNYHLGFQYVAKGKIEYNLYDYNTGSLSPRYSVFATNKINSLAFIIRKDIRLIK
jgi:hypothetical protein